MNWVEGYFWKDEWVEGHWQAPLEKVEDCLEQLLKKQIVERVGSGWRLTPKGEQLAKL